MYCSTCGAELPEKSKFCLNCGKPVASPAKSVLKEKIEWEYKDYVDSWSHKQVWYRTSKNTDTQVRLDVWMNYQTRISTQLQILYDEGWEPIGEVGPSCIKLREYTEWDGASAIIWTIATAGLALIIAPFLRESFTEPAEFRLKMRRPAIVTNKSSSSIDFTQTNHQRVSVEKVVKHKQVSDDINEVKYWGSKIFRCPSCSKLNNPVYGNSCVNCNSQLSNSDLIDNPYKYLHR